jgi:hypothetical protein
MKVGILGQFLRNYHHHFLYHVYPNIRQEVFPNSLPKKWAVGVAI